MPNSVDDIYATLDNVAPAGTFSQLISARHDDGGACPVVVLITGTTGSFGSATLAKLIESEAISKVYAMNRPSMDAIPLLDRQQEALRTRGYNPALALSPKLVLIEAVMTGDNLGIDATRNGEIHRRVTHIIHNAWRVNFASRLSSFEGLLDGMRILIKFAITAKQAPRFLFVSSVGVSLWRRRGSVEEAAIDDPQYCGGIGYCSSKWIGEQMLFRAARESPLSFTIVRTGQISGGLNGSWNTSDNIPSVIHAGVEMKCLPTYNITLQWIPLDLAASCMIDFVQARDPSEVVNLVLPAFEMQSGRSVFQTVGEFLRIPMVSNKEWVQRIHAKGRTLSWQDKSSTMKLMIILGELFVDQESGKDSRIEPNMDCEKALQMSPSLRKAEQLYTSEVVESWISHWIEIGFLSKVSAKETEMAKL